MTRGSKNGVDMSILCGGKNLGKRCDHGLASVFSALCNFTKVQDIQEEMKIKRQIEGGKAI